MNHKDLKQLQTLREYPALSILAPTHRTAPANAQDPIRIKNLVTEATARLLDEFPKREVESLLEMLNGLVEEIDWRYTLDGIALFVSSNFAARFDLPFSVQERVAIDETFATRDIVFALNRSPRYWVLVLSEQPTRLFEAVRDGLEEKQIGAFPMEHIGPGGAARLPGGHGVNSSAVRDEHQRHFFRSVDEELTKVLADDSLPVGLVGIGRNLAFFDEITQNKSSITATLEGSHDSTPPHELGRLVWPPMQEALATQRGAILDRLGEAVGSGKHAAGLSEVWQLAQEGRGEVLLIEEGFHQPGRLDESGLNLVPLDGNAGMDGNGMSNAEVMDDAVDSLVETVLDKGGRVVFTDSGALEEHNRVAMILRY
jgi:hypothetical protein